MSDPAPCPLCESAETRSVGPIVHPEPALVAGVPIDLGDVQYELRACDACGFQFKWPAIDELKLLACYGQAEPAHWEESPDPRKRRWDDLRDVIGRHKPSGRLLDIGCFNGALQQYLGDRWQHFGVEPAREAAAVAARRGVEIIGATIDDVDGGAQPFDVIVAIDVSRRPRSRSSARVIRMRNPGDCSARDTGTARCRNT